MTAPPPHPLVHASEAVLRPGEIVEAASARGYRSPHARCPGYDPTKVYVLDAGADPISYEQHGRHAYRVEPIGELSPDPERDPARWPIADEDPFAFSWCCQSARVTAVIY